MRQPPKGKQWLHIDRLDRADGKVWAVQSERGYEVFADVIVNAVGYTQLFPSKKQPRAVIEFDGATVRCIGQTAYIE